MTDGARERKRERERERERRGEREEREDCVMEFISPLAVPNVCKACASSRSANLASSFDPRVVTFMEEREERERGERTGRRK